MSGSTKRKTPGREDASKASLGNRSALHIAVWIFILLTAVYSLVYSGTFITDDEHILASRSLSLAFDGNLNDLRIFGNSRVFTLSQLPAGVSVAAVNIEPVQALAGSVLTWLAVLLNAGRVQTIFLLNIWVTALTAVFIFLAVVRRGYSKSTALITSLLFGLATIAFPYSRTYFRDSLAMFFLAGSWMCAQIIIDSLRGSNVKGQVGWPVWLGLVLGLIFGTLTKNTILIALPVLAAEILICRIKSSPPQPRSSSKRKDGLAKTLLIATGTILVLLIFWVIIVPRFDSLSRFSFQYYASLIKFFFTSSHPHFLNALLGPLVSPGKSIFIYSPILIISLLSLCRFWRKAWSAWAYLLLLIVGQALFYDSAWWGTVNWGLRFVLPAVPVLMISSAPVIEDWLKGKVGRIGLIVLGATSFFVQLLGALVPIKTYFTEMFKIDPSMLESSAVWQLEHSQWLAHLTWLMRGGKADLAAFRIGASSFPIMLGFILIVVLSCFGISRISGKWLRIGALTLTLCLTMVLPTTLRSDPQYFLKRSDLAESHHYIALHFLPGDIVLIKSYATPAWFFWMNWADSTVPWISLPYYYPDPSLISDYWVTHDPEIALDQATLSLFQGLEDSYQRVWLVAAYDSPGIDLGIEADWLSRESISQKSWAFGRENEKTTVYLFDLRK